MWFLYYFILFEFSVNIKPPSQALALARPSGWQYKIVHLLVYCQLTLCILIFDWLVNMKIIVLLFILLTHQPQMGWSHKQKNGTFSCSKSNVVYLLCLRIRIK